MGLEGALFLLLDQEQEEVIRRDVQETLVHLLVSGVQRGRLLHWIKLCKDVLSASSGPSPWLPSCTLQPTCYTDMCTPNMLHPACPLHVCHLMCH